MVQFPRLPAAALSALLAALPAPRPAAAQAAAPVPAAPVPAPPVPAAPGDLRGPALGAAANLSQGRQPDAIRLGRALGVEDFRDGMNWARVETRPGTYAFSGPRGRFPEQIGATGAHASIVLNWGNPLYDGGDTPQSPAALAAFGAFAGALARRFPAIDSLEIGNEFNGVNFVRGPLEKMAPLERARAYVPLLAAAAEGARAARPGIRILGGATHSIPAGYLWTLLDAGGAGLMDALALHPYTTPAEQLVRQLAVLRRHPAAARLPVEVTEFGTPGPARAAGHFLRNYCQMALAGVTRAVWYPLNDRGDGMVPLFGPGGRITPAGRAFRLAAARMEGRPVADAAPDPFTYGCRFGTDVLVLWGAPRPVEVAPGTEVLDAAGAEVAGPWRLDATAPLVFIAPDVAQAVRPAAPGRVADSYDQFAYPQDDEAQAAGDGFARFARQAGREIPLVTLPGQERRGVPWFPYRGAPDLPGVRLTPETLLPGGGRGGPVEIVHRYTAPRDETLDLEASFSVAKASKDGIAVTVTRAGTVLAEAAGRDPIRIARAGIALARGETLEIAVGPGGTPRGDATSYRITLSRAGG